MYARFNSRAAPANSDSTSAPARPGWHAIYSLATRFIPSRSGVTSMTEAIRYIAAIVALGKPACL